MTKNPIRTNWKPGFDDKPTSDIPRIKFSQTFSKKYLVNTNLVLEVGCGTGSYTRLIDRKGCLGLDLDIDAVRIAKRYCKNSEFIVASALNLPFKEETFDVICMWGVFEEIPKGREEQIINEIRKILTSKGVLLISVYTNHIISKMLDPAFIFRGVRHYNLTQFLNLIVCNQFFINEYAVRGNMNTIIANFLVYFYKHILKRKEGALKSYFDKKSSIEINSGKKGMVYSFIAANKSNQLA